MKMRRITEKNGKRQKKETGSRRKKKKIIGKEDNFKEGMHRK